MYTGRSVYPNRKASNNKGSREHSATSKFARVKLRQRNINSMNMELAKDCSVRNV